MKKEEIKKVISFLQTNYPNYNFKKELTDYWKQELVDYDFEDIDTKIKQLMSEERYAYQPPLLEAITRGLTKKQNKTNFDELTYFCMFCKRPFNDRNELEEHQDRCRSIKYIISQYKRFNLGEIDNNKKRELYELPEEEFDRQYKIILKYVMQHTNDESERTRIGFIFNPPTPEQARAYFQNN